MREACSSEKSARSRLGACRERARRSGAGRLVINGGFPVARDLQAGVPVADHEVASAAKATMAARPSDTLSFCRGLVTHAVSAPQSVCVGVRERFCSLNALPSDRRKRARVGPLIWTLLRD